jgi:hypothetical protein
MGYVLYSYAAMRELILNQGVSPLKLMVDDTVWLYDDDKVTPEFVGAIPSWINAKDPTHLKDQINRNYAHGGGWHDFGGFKASLDEDLYMNIKYPGDPALREVARGMVYREGFKRMDIVLMFPHSWVAVLEDGAVRHPTGTIDQKKIHIARIN